MARHGPAGYALLALFWAVMLGLAMVPWLLLGWAGGLVSWFLAAAVVLAVTWPPRRHRQVQREARRLVQQQHGGDGSVNIQAGRDLAVPYDGRPDGDEQA